MINFLGLLFTVVPPVECPEGGMNPSRMPAKAIKGA
jgi:hypothetical protein